MEIKRNKIVIIVGAGAVENAWVPIVNAIKVFRDQTVDIDCANCFLARLIYLLRFYTPSRPRLSLFSGAFYDKKQVKI